jgi:hypothetical protein
MIRFPRCSVCAPVWLAMSLLLALVILPAGQVEVLAGIHDTTIFMPPSDEVVHFTDGYLIAPGFIDLSALIFTAISESFGAADDDTVFDDDRGGFYGGPPHRNRRQRQLAVLKKEQQRPQSRQLGGGVEIGSSKVDIAVFSLPDSCADTPSGCDWTDLGIGAKTADNTTRWCCSGDDVKKGLCTGGHDDYGRLIIKYDKFNGDHRFVEISQTGAVSKTVKYARMEERVTGQYVVLFANCNPSDGREVTVTGETLWKSKHGFLPGKLFEFMYFYIFLVIVYFGLLLWYGISMKLNEASRIPIEKWILTTIVLGLVEHFFRTSDYMIWNADGYRQDLVTHMAIFTGVVKRGISRCLIVMVALGWGVVRDSLGSTMRVLVVLGAIYVGASAAQSLMLILLVEDTKTLSFGEEEELVDVMMAMTSAVKTLNFIFIVWIIYALNGTMKYLENMNQSRKLMRYVRLRRIFLLSIIFAVVLEVFSFDDANDEEGIVREEQEWVIDAATELNYLFVLITVAILWRPNPSAKDYAFVMELPAMGGEDEDENALELTDNTPSAMEDKDGKEPSSRTNGNHDDDDEFHDDRFQIDDAEAT